MRSSVGVCDVSVFLFLFYGVFLECVALAIQTCFVEQGSCLHVGSKWILRMWLYALQRHRIDVFHMSRYCLG